MDERFTGQTVIVTGASAGIGVGVARRFHAEGANVVLAARRRGPLDVLAEELGKERTLSIVTDVTDATDVQAMVEATVRRFGGVNVLVSNAGSGLLKSFQETTLEDWRHMMATNVESCFLCARAAVPHLKTTRGSVIHIASASASGMGGDRNLTAYNAAKAAVVNFTRGLAFDLGEYGIRVNAVAPALSLSHDAAPQWQPSIERFNQRRALKGYSTPDDIGAAAAFLASQDARFITGVILPVDGGITAGSGQPDLT